jgi:hypothetical protein
VISRVEQHAGRAKTGGKHLDTRENGKRGSRLAKFLAKQG